ncbi:hypothetical protein TSAR_004967 [Trichomalopsis sarcophagae]|uniref:Uncharacterized protein n=1 Tax=Trichomalopsis sarcophagae TaxID=543379 RepID=A0A232EGJ8_9HYME|nr:hypothetical protein TSAR_004967 [Trichomalopsis sarcophagae]
MRTNFYVVQNIVVDVMHDLLEGICRYDVAFLLNRFIYKRRMADCLDLISDMGIISTNWQN